MSVTVDDFGTFVYKTVREMKLERVNILVAGQTGVGKSTLINAVFGEEVAKAGLGSPVTQNAQWYVSKSSPINILDTKGIEAKDFEATMQLLQDEVFKGRSNTDVTAQIHIAWICINEQSGRIQAAEIEIVRILKQNNIPVIVVMTKAIGNNTAFHDEAKKIFAQSGLSISDIVPINSLPYEISDDEEGNSTTVVGVKGLKKLVERTDKLIPEAVGNAFAAAQKVNFDLKKEASDKIIKLAAAMAGAAAMSPIPFSDSLAIVPIQIGMIIKISMVYGMNFDESAVLPIITSVSGALGFSVVGRIVAGNLLKFIPGFGTLVGDAINATTASALTLSFGNTYLSFLENFVRTHGRIPTLSEITDVFPNVWKNNEVTVSA